MLEDLTKLSNGDSVMAGKHECEHDFSNGFYCSKCNADEDKLKKITRWLWAIKLGYKWLMAGYFFTDEEAKAHWPEKEIRKLPWSATEFPDD